MTLWHMFLVLLLPQAFAYFEIPSEVPPPGGMNGIEFHDYSKFPETWHFVTARYREDSKEMRFVFANDLAWKTLKSFKPNYPDGAAFGKVGFMSEADPAFPSSVVPSGAKRFQIMVKNRAKYKDSDGWGYALFDGKGGAFTGAAKPNLDSCTACHRIVPERDFVFSRPADLMLNSSFPRIDLSHADKSIINFEKTPAGSLSAQIRMHLGEDVKTVETLNGALKKTAFAGTLDEVMPLLLTEVQRTGLPAVLEIDRDNFSIAAPNPHPVNPCSLKSYKLLVMFNGKPLRNSENCQ